MMYVVHFGLLLVLLVEFVLLEVYGTLSGGQSVMAWLTYAVVPGLLLAKPLQRPAIERYATAWSLATFAAISIGIGWTARQNAIEHRDLNRMQLLKAPLDIERSYSNQLSLSTRRLETASRSEANVDSESPLNYAVPDGLDADTADRLRLGIYLAHKWLHRFNSDRDYEKVRHSFESDLRREVDEKAERYLRTVREAKIGAFFLALGATALAISITAFALRWRRERIRTESIT